jgi:hypothetical protein
MELAGAPAHCSYHRETLLSVGGFPETMRAGEDTIVNQELSRRGHRAYRAQDVTIIHRSPCRTPWKLVRHHFVRGRAFGRILRDRDGVFLRTPCGVAAWALAQGLLSERLTRTRTNVKQWAGDPALAAQFQRVYPLVVLGAAAAVAGTWFELWRPSQPDAELRPHSAEG